MDDLRDALENLADDIRSVDGRIAALQALLLHIEREPESFSDGECEATRICIEALVGERAQKLKILRDKVEVYESRVLDLTKKLDVRKRIFDENPESLRGAPDLLELFVDQHAAITAELNAARAFLLAS